MHRPGFSATSPSPKPSIFSPCARMAGLVLLLLVSSAAKLLAQSNYGALRGLVTDAQGATVDKASVVLTNQATRFVRKATSNGAGEYVFSAVDPATYTVEIEAGGFKKYERKGVIVDTGNTVSVDVKLDIGTTQQTIEVDAAEPLIDNGTASNGQVIDSQKLETLPNMGRNPFFFSKLDNNVTQVGDPRFVRFQDQSGSSQISLGGGPIAANNYEIDGVPITDFLNRAVIIPSIESTEEVKVQYDTYDAEMGRTGGGMFNTTLKSGSNTYHGVLQGETRQTNWGANSFFNYRSPFFNGTTTLPQTPRGAAEFYSYVGAIGGPLSIPHLYNGKDRTFFWIAEEGYRQRSPLSNSYYVPTALERAGDFSQSNINIYDPSQPIVNGRRPQFMGVKNGVPTPNVIPASQINKVGANIMSAFPLPNQIVSGTAAFGSNNFFGEDTLGDRADEFTGKIDQQVTRWWLANASYMHYGSKEPGGDLLGTFPGGATSYLLYRKVDSTLVNSTFTVNPTTIITAGFGFNRFPNNSLDLSNGYNQTALGLPAGYVSSLQKAAFPRITGQNMAQLGTGNSGPAVFFSRSFVAGISKSLGKHSLKAGYVFRSISVSFTNVGGGNGTFGFDSSYTSKTGAVNTKNDPTLGGADSASLLLGYPSSGSVAVTTPLAINTHYNAVYLQDDYRATPKLTLNLGLRYEHEPGINERNNHYAVGFNRSVVNPITTTSGVNTLGGVEYAGVNGYPTICCDNSNLKFAPRFGLAYALTPSTVLRGGFGVFYAPIAYSTDPSLAPGYTQTNTFVAPSATAASTPSLGNPFPSGPVAPSGNSNGYLTAVGSSLNVLDQYRRSPIVDQYSADIERQLPSGFVIKLGYVGAHGRNLPDSYNLNQLPNSQLGLGAGLGASVANPYYQKGGVGVIGGKTVHQSQLLLPFPEFSTVTVATSVGHSQYNALDMKLQKRFSHGLTVLAGYTWASNWDNSWGAGSSLNSGDNGPADIYNLAPEYARAINDMPNRFTVTGTYDLPFGRGKQFLSGSRWLDIAVGGWQFNDVTILQSGSPLALSQSGTAPSGTFGIGGSTQRPTYTGAGNACGSGSPEGRLNNYTNRAAFKTTPAFQYGNVARTVNCYGPGYVNSDLSFNKTFRVTEGVTAQFRAEALNAFNTPEFATPNNTVGNANFGKITQTLGFPRLVQLGGRLSF